MPVRDGPSSLPPEPSSRVSQSISNLQQLTLPGFSPHSAHDSPTFFGWIIPTIRTSEFTVLQIVGLDAAVLLSFFKMSFYLFSVCSVYAVAILMPINWKHNKDIMRSPGDEDGDQDEDWPYFSTGNSTTNPDSDWLDLISDANTYLSLHLVSVYIFTFITLFFLSTNYRRFLRTRQLFSLELVHSIPARTILVTNVPLHLRSERAVAEYFEGLDLMVESVSVVREVEGLKKLLQWRTSSLLKLEKAWCEYVGNPSTVEEYNPEGGPLIDIESQISNIRSNRQQLVVPNKPRPTLRPIWWKVWHKVDKLEYYEREFTLADEAFRKRRRTGKFRATQCAFVTFEKMSSAVRAITRIHAPKLTQSTANSPSNNPLPTAQQPHRLPCPRAQRHRLVEHDAYRYRAPHARHHRHGMHSPALLHLPSPNHSPRLPPILRGNQQEATLAWGNYSEQRCHQGFGPELPSLRSSSTLLNHSDANVVQMAMIALNALLPTLLETLCYVQGFRARSWVEYSLLKKYVPIPPSVFHILLFGRYFLFLLINVVFIFLLASTYWQLVRDLANDPAKIPEKLAKALGTGKARCVQNLTNDPTN